MCVIPRDAFTRKWQRGEICQKGTKDTILMPYQGTDLREGHWERRIFEILEFTKGTNSCGLTISGRGWPTAYHATMQKKFELREKTNFPINGCKLEKIKGHTLRALLR